ncbi:MAG: DUF6112 family protein [Acidimicrobiales bacterium]
MLSLAASRLAFSPPSGAVPGTTDVVPFTPSPSGIPGASVIETLTNGLGWWALVASLVALVLGAAAWALGSHTNNYQASSAGRRAVIVAAAAALVIGAAPTIVNFLFAEGKGFGS